MKHSNTHWLRPLGQHARVALTGGLALLSLTLGASQALAIECLLPPVSVPGLYGAPQWYTSGGLSLRTELDDPRWGGAPITSFANDGVGTTAAYRVLVYGDQLNVSFQGLADDNGAGSGDIIYLGISTNSGGTAAKILAISPRDSGGSDPIAMNAGLDYQLFEKTSAAGSWGPGSSTPPTWLTAVHTWRNTPAGAVWAVNLKIDLAGFGLAASSSFHMGFGMTVTNSVGPVPFHTPDYAGGTALASSTLLPADASTWPEYSPRGTACTTGVSLSPYAIGTTSASGRTHVDNSANTFFADVENIPTPISVGKILARFSIANWGSTVADPAAGWNEFSISTAGDGYVPDATHGTWTSPAPAPASSASARITFTCAVPSGETYCPVITASSANRDQCLLVELKPAPGTGTTIKFQNAAARQNMTFATTSTLDRDAVISTKGLQSITGQARDRDVYIYVQTSNMPGPGNTPYFLPAAKMAEAKRYAETPPALPQPPAPDNQDTKRAAAAGTNIAAAAAVPGVPKDGSVFIRDERLVPVLSPDQKLMQVWPTYRVHVYYDTGRKQSIEGTPKPVLAPLVPFGLFLSHDGPLYGFTHALRGLGGVTLEEVAPNFYKVHIKNEGSIRVATHITSEEHSGNSSGSCGSCPCRPPPVHVNVKGCFCAVPGRNAAGDGALGLLALIPALAFMLRRRRDRGGRAG